MAIDPDAVASLSTHAAVDSDGSNYSAPELAGHVHTAPLPRREAAAVACAERRAAAVAKDIEQNSAAEAAEATAWLRAACTDGQQEVSTSLSWLSDWLNTVLRGLAAADDKASSDSASIQTSSAPVTTGGTTVAVSHDCGRAGQLSPLAVGSLDAAVDSNDCYSFHLHGPPTKSGGRSVCSTALLRLPQSGDDQRGLMRSVLDEYSNSSCITCGSALRDHRASYLRGQRRILMQSGGSLLASSVECRVCERRLHLPETWRDSVPMVAFLGLLWGARVPLRCGHALENGIWHLSGCEFILMRTRVVKLEMRGPPLLRYPAAPLRRPFIEECLSIVSGAEELLENDLRGLLAEVRRTKGGASRRSWFGGSYAEFSRRCQNLIEAQRQARICAAAVRQHAQKPHHELVDLGIVCRVCCCLSNCRALALSASRNQAMCNTELKQLCFVASEDCHPQAARRAASAPPRLQKDEQLVVEDLAGVNMDDLFTWLAGYWIPDEMLAPENLSAHARPLPDVHTPTSLRKQAQSWPVAAEGQGSSLATRAKEPTVSRSKAIPRFEPTKSVNSTQMAMLLKEDDELLVATDGENTVVWDGLCSAPSEVLNRAGLCVGTDPDMCVATGVQGMGIPLRFSLIDGMGAVIAHALLSTRFWQQLRPRLVGRCLPSCSADVGGQSHCFRSLIGDERVDPCSQSKDLAILVDDDPNITVEVFGSEGAVYTVQVVRPACYHELRHILFGDDASFCNVLRTAIPSVVTGGKSNAGFWTSADGSLILKEVKSGEAKALEETLAKRLVEHCLAAAKGKPSTLCEIVGVFKVSEAGSKVRTVIIMRNISFRLNCSVETENMENGVWELFDIKGTGRARSTAAKGSEGQNAVEAGSTVDVRWDQDFLEALGGFPLSLCRQDYAFLLEALESDMKVLEELGLVDYSMLVALRRTQSLDQRVGAPVSKPTVANGAACVGNSDSDAAFRDDGSTSKRPLAWDRIRLGIIDYLQPYSLAKQIESQVKQVFRGAENTTIVEPAQYSRRFRNFFITRAVELLPDAAQ